ncbi:MAG: lamin tail domain-containing protein [Candidatus Altiarchaeota archaeon]|nr:lamin tail domain-containing protein [Candidatus Altiarchaeota archaeon]
MEEEGGEPGVYEEKPLGETVEDLRESLATEEPADPKETVKKHKTLEEHVISSKIMLISAIIIIVLIAVAIMIIQSPTSESTVVCGDNTCAPSESCSACEADCGPCPLPEPEEYCGDGVCGDDEGCAICPRDCPCPTPEPFCGDGTCLGDEDCGNCAQDCGECESCDNDGLCETKNGETEANCEDCKGLNVNCCGDGECQEIVCMGSGCCASESCSSCPKDCGSCSTGTPAGSCLDCINIYELKNDGVGDDCVNLNGEYVTFRNRCDYDCDLTGWTVGNKNNKIYTIPRFVLGSKERVTLYTGKGTDSDTRLYWDSKGWACNEIWDDNTGTVFLKDSQGNVALAHTYW